MALKPKPRISPNTPLTDPVRERYAVERAAGLGKSAAYRKANPNAKKMTSNTIAVAASRFESEEEIQTRIQEVQTDLLKSSDSLLSKQQLAELITDELRTMAREEGGLASAASLVDKYCKMFGFYTPEKTEVSLKCADESTVNAKVASLLNLT